MDTQAVVAAPTALAQESRLAIFRLPVQRGPAGMAAAKTGEQLGIAPCSMSFHPNELARAEPVPVQRDGRSMIHSANVDVMNALRGFLTANCCGGNGRTPASACRPTKKSKT
jgi:hypothetical protein